MIAMPSDGEHSFIRWRRAIISGAVAGVVVIVIMSLLAPLAGVDADLCVPIGAALGFQNYMVAAGCVAQIVIGAIAGIVYAFVFEYVTGRAGWWVGVLIGIGHACIAGLGVGYLFVYRPPVEGVSVPGGFMLFRGVWAAAILVVAHIIFGAIVGASYGRAIHNVQSEPLVWRDA